MNVYMVMKHCEKVLETTIYQTAVNECKRIDATEGYGASSLWYMDTNKSNTFSRLNFYPNTMASTSKSSTSIHDNSIWRK